MNNKDIYDKYLDTQYSSVEKTDFNNKGDVAELLKRNFPPISHNFKDFFDSKVGKKSKILDLGCGWGRFIFFLKSLNYTNVTGLDMSPQEIDLCKDMFPAYKFIESDIFSYIKNTKDKYDLIYLSHVLEHIPKKRLFELLMGLKKILTNKGVIIVIVPNSSAYFNSLVGRYADITHEIGFTDKSMKQLVTLAGFNKITIENYYGVGNFFLNMLRFFFIRIFEISIQIMGYDKQEIYTPSMIAIFEK